MIKLEYCYDTQQNAYDKDYTCYCMLYNSALFFDLFLQLPYLHFNFCSFQYYSFSYVQTFDVLCVAGCQ